MHSHKFKKIHYSHLSPESQAYARQEFIKDVAYYHEEQWDDSEAHDHLMEYDKDNLFEESGVIISNHSIYV